MADPYQPPTRVVFPDHELLVPLMSWSDNHGVLRHDDPVLHFHFSLTLEEDEAIQYWRRNLGNPDPAPGMPVKMATVGLIYLNIHSPDSAFFDETPAGGLVAFDFGTTGTRMSLLFDESPSIRAAFLGLLARVPGVCGVFNREDSGEVFWMDGEPVDNHLDDPYLPPRDIRLILGKA